jgi:predicted nuclease of predicted toxin-antitoxin system
MYGGNNDCQAVLTQDEDFSNLLLEFGPPPKIIRLRLGNCSVAFLAEVLLSHKEVIQKFLENEGQDILEIY